MADKDSATRQLGGVDSAAMSKPFEEMGLDPNEYTNLMDEFNRVLEDTLGDQTLEKFRLQYEKLHRALKTTYENEKRLVNKCTELQETIVKNAVKVKQAIMLTKQVGQTIQTLKKEIQKAWVLIDVAKDKDEKARNLIQRLRAEITELTSIVEQGQGLSIG